MAAIVKRWPGPQRTKERHHREHVYKFAPYLDGRIHRLSTRDVRRLGKTTSLQSFRQGFYFAGALFGKQVRTAFVDGFFYVHAFADTSI